MVMVIQMSENIDKIAALESRIVELEGEIRDAYDAAVLRGAQPECDGIRKSLVMLIADTLHDMLNKNHIINDLHDKVDKLESELELAKALHNVAVLQRDSNQLELDSMDNKLSRTRAELLDYKAALVELVYRLNERYSYQVKMDGSDSMPMRIKEAYVNAMDVLNKYSGDNK